MNATPKQLFCLYLGTKINTKGLEINKETASMLISRMKNGEDISDILIGYGGVKTETATKVDYKALYDKAHQIAHEAAINHNPTPMIVSEHSNPLDDSSDVKNQYYVADGVCGFSSIRFKLNTAFGKWAVKNKIAEKSCTSGAYIWVHDYSQSYERKNRYASAFCKFMNENGVKCYAESRLD
jgi:hypothetical protein